MSPKVIGMRLDAVLAAALFAVLARVTVALGHVSVWGWVWLVALHLPLVVRRRWPVAVFWTVTAAAFAAVTFALTGPALLIVPAVAGYTLARHRSRRALWPVVVPVGAFIVGWWWHDGPLWDALTLSTAFAAALLLGAYLQTRRAYLTELEERARRLEHEREQQDRLAVAAERARIAREMHDIVAHNLAVMVALADGAAAVTQGTPDRGVDMMRQTAMTGRQALTEIRRLIGLLRVSEEDSQLAPQPGLDDLDELVDQVRAAGLAVTLTRTGTCDLGAGAELAIYRIVQEALTNTIKHAGQHATAEVRLSCDGTTADVEITDDGGDGVTTTARPGHGLTGMTERAASYGGRVAAGPGAARGWRVHAHLGLDGR